MPSGHIDKLDFNIENYSFAKVLVRLRFRLIESYSIVAELSRLRMVRPQFRGRPSSSNWPPACRRPFFERLPAVPS
ncbi:hypothetical protein HNQ36_003272 [Afipia massiliensis]|uniref:Uncharacterized protein n=1 Tax=Afipia massiliensis TaxID=211460 RepID=A0A840N682_9BRAD|nr:hypothetical protein [Afipia massiliensis]